MVRSTPPAPASHWSFVRGVARGSLYLFLTLALLCFFSARRPAGVHAFTDKPAPLEAPDRACAACHQASYDKFEQTSMARGSGVAADGLITGGFEH